MSALSVNLLKPLRLLAECIISYDLCITTAKPNITAAVKNCSTRYFNGYFIVIYVLHKYNYQLFR
jgi:hypothetical protein